MVKPSKPFRGLKMIIFDKDRIYSLKKTYIKRLKPSPPPKKNNPKNNHICLWYTFRHRRNRQYHCDRYLGSGGCSVAAIGPLLYAVVIFTGQREPANPQTPEN